MYYADPADGGEPSRGFFNARLTSIILLCVSVLCYSCQQRQKQPVMLSTLLTFGPIDVPAQEKKPAPPPKPVKKKKKIYLTFDDGPNKGTQNVLNIVKEEEVPATFFIVGEHVFASIGQARTWDSLKMAKNIELCNHSYTHAHNRYDKFYQHPDTVVKDMKRTQEELMPDNYVVRTPGRNSWRIDSLHFTDIKKSKAAIDSLQAAGFVVLGWDVEWHYDHKTMSVSHTADELLTLIDSTFSKGKTKVKDNLVVLAHDQVYKKSEDSVQLRVFIQKLKQKEDYELALVSSYPGVKAMDSLAIAAK